jgi:hypothetical protein
MLKRTSSITGKRKLPLVVGDGVSPAATAVRARVSGDGISPGNVSHNEVGSTGNSGPERVDGDSPVLFTPTKQLSLPIHPESSGRSGGGSSGRPPPSPHSNSFESPQTAAHPPSPQYPESPAHPPCAFGLDWDSNERYERVEDDDRGGDGNSDDDDDHGDDEGGGNGHGHGDGGVSKADRKAYQTRPVQTDDSGPEEEDLAEAAGSQSSRSRPLCAKAPSVTDMILNLRTDGDECANLKDYQRAVTLYSKAVRMIGPWTEPTLTASVLCNRASAYVALRDFEAAKCDAEGAIALDRKWAKAHYCRGTAMDGMNRMADANKSFMEVMKLKKNIRIRWGRSPLTKAGGGSPLPSPPTRTAHTHALSEHTLTPEAR